MSNPRTRIARYSMVLGPVSKARPISMVGTVDELELGAKASHASANPAIQYTSAQYERLRLRIMEEGHVPSS